MRKVSLFFLVAALLGAALILGGCPEAETVYVPVEGELPSFQPPADAVEADNSYALAALLADTGALYNHIIYAKAPDVDITVPAGKTLYLTESSGDLDLGAKITVAGKLVVYSTTFTPAAYLTGTGTLDVEAGATLTVTADTLFTGVDKLGAVNVKKFGTLDAEAVTVDTAAKIGNWLVYAGDGGLKLTVTVLTPSATLAAIGPQSVIQFGPYSMPSVEVTNDVAPTGTETSLTVPKGVMFTTNNALAAVKTLTVNGAISASIATFNSTDGVTITVDENADVKLEGTVGKLAADIVVPASASFMIGTVTGMNGKTVTYRKGGKSIISDIDLVFSGFDATAGYTLNDNITLASGQIIVIPENKVIVKAGKKITNNGTITLAPTGSLVLSTASGSQSSIEGTGKLVAGATTITGTWTTTATGDGTVTILSGADGVGATIAAATAATGLAAGTGGTITQAAGSGNTLTIAAATTIALGGDGTAVGSIVLKGADSNPGKLTFANTGADGGGTSLVTTAATSAANKVTGTVTAPGTGTALVWYAANAGTGGKWSKLGASNATNGLTGGSGTTDITLSGASTVTAT
ncbi:MAG: hypothetical protein LBD86_01780, partial [Spirochaetaceae bacterium]|nr:hypothetical protein [Spirochaetaceae bacterium]